jgi:hypothetical protein
MHPMGAGSLPGHTEAIMLDEIADPRIDEQTIVHPGDAT